MELGESSWIKAPVKEVRTVRYRQSTFVSALYKLDLGVCSVTAPVACVPLEITFG
jgi:hypothetical protein